MTMLRRHLTAGVIAGSAMLALGSVAGDALAEGADDAAVGKAVEAFRKAMQAADRAQFEALCATHLSYGHSAGKIETKPEFIAASTSGKTTWKTIEFSDVKNSVVGNNAISRFMLTGETESEGKLTPIKIGVLMVWLKEENAWKLLARQAFKV